MNRSSGKATDKPLKRRRPAITVDAREDQMVALATDLAEKQLADGTASAQVISFYLKMGSSRERLEKEILKKEHELLQAKTDALQSVKRSEELYAEALKAIQSYTSQSSDPTGDPSWRK